MQKQVCWTAAAHSLTAVGKERQLAGRNKHPKTATGRERGECNRSPCRNLEMLRIQSLLPLIGYLIQALLLLRPPVRGPHNIHLLSSSPKASASFKAHSRIHDLEGNELSLSLTSIKPQFPQRKLRCSKVAYQSGYRPDSERHDSCTRCSQARLSALLITRTTT